MSTLILTPQSMLQHRFLEAACDRSDFSVVLYRGRLDAFPEQVLRGECDGVRWPIAVPTGAEGACPVGMHLASLAEDIGELLVCFGDCEALKAYRLLARAALEDASGYATPDGHAHSEASQPEAAWTRWLFESSAPMVDRFVVGWHAEQPKQTLTTPKDQSFDPLRQPIDEVCERLVQRGFKRFRGFRPWGCLAFKFCNSVFKVSAAAVGGVATTNPNEARDKWLYEQCCSSTVYKQIQSKLQRRAESEAWEPIESVSGIKAAANRYAQRHNLPSPPKRQRGRPKK